MLRVKFNVLDRDFMRLLHTTKHPKFQSTSTADLHRIAVSLALVGVGEDPIAEDVLLDGSGIAGYVPVGAAGAAGHPVR